MFVVYDGPELDGVEVPGFGVFEKGKPVEVGDGFVNDSLSAQGFKIVKDEKGSGK